MTDQELKKAYQTLQDVFSEATKKRDQIVKFWAEKYVEEKLTQAETQRALYREILAKTGSKEVALKHGVFNIERGSLKPHPGSGSSIGNESRDPKTRDGSKDRSTVSNQLSKIESTRDLLLAMPDLPPSESDLSLSMTSGDVGRSTLSDIKNYPEEFEFHMSNILAKRASVKEIDIDLDSYGDLLKPKTDDQRTGASQTGLGSGGPSNFNSLSKGDHFGFSSHRALPTFNAFAFSKDPNKQSQPTSGHNSHRGSINAPPMTKIPWPTKQPPSNGASPITMSNQKPRNNPFEAQPLSNYQSLPRAKESNPFDDYSPSEGDKGVTPNLAKSLKNQPPAPGRRDHDTPGQALPKDETQTFQKFSWNAKAWS